MFSSVTSPSGLIGAIAALLTRMSTYPKAAIITENSFANWRCSLMSASIAISAAPAA
jgi:hypothetical protein